MKRILLRALIASACTGVVLAGYRFAKINQVEPVKGIWAGDTVFCTVFRKKTLILPDSSFRFFRTSPGKTTLFHFGHKAWTGTETQSKGYWLELDSALEQFDFDSSQFRNIRFYSESASMIAYEVGILKRGRIAGRKASDSTWLLTEWISPDYFEARRRKYYKTMKVQNGPGGGFERLCIEKR